MPAPYGARAGGGMRRLRLRRRTFSGCRRPSRPRGVACAIPVVKAEAASATSVDHLVSDPRLKPVGLPGTPLTPGRGARVTHRLVEDTSRLGVVAHRIPGILPASPFPSGGLMSRPYISRPPKDMTSQRFGRLVVVNFAGFVQSPTRLVQPQGTVVTPDLSVVLSVDHGLV